MDLLSKYGTDPETSLNGKWIDVDNDCKVLIARWQNNRHREAMQARVKTVKGEPTREQAERFLQECVAETILLDWQGMTLDGEELPYSKENALKILSDPRLRDFLDYVVGQSATMENYRLSHLEKDVGN